MNWVSLSRKRRRRSFDVANAAEIVEPRVLLSASSSDPNQDPDPGSGSDPDPGSGSSSGSNSNDAPVTATVNIVFTEEIDWAPGGLHGISDDGAADFVNSVPFNIVFTLDTSASGPFWLVTEVNGVESSRNEVTPSPYLQSGYSGSAPLVKTAGGDFVANVDVRMEGPNGTVASDSDTDNAQTVETSAPDWLGTAPFRFADKLRPGSATAEALKSQLDNQIDAMFANYADEQFQNNPQGPTDDQIEAMLDPFIPEVSSTIYNQAFTVGVAGLNAAQDSTVGKWIFHTASRNKAVGGLGQLTADSGKLIKNGIMADLYSRGKMTQEEVQDWIGGNTPNWLKAADEYVNLDISYGNPKDFFDIPSFGTVLNDIGDNKTILNYLKPNWKDQIVVRHAGATLPFGTEVFELPAIGSSFQTAGSVGANVRDFTTGEPYPHGWGASAHLDLLSPVGKEHHVISNISFRTEYTANVFPLPVPGPTHTYAVSVNAEIRYYGSLFGSLWKEWFVD